MKKKLSKAELLNRIPLVLFALVFLGLALWAQQAQTPAPAPAPAAAPAPATAPAPNLHRLRHRSSDSPHRQRLRTGVRSSSACTRIGSLRLPHRRRLQRPQGSAPEAKPSPEEPTKANPVKATAESLAKGKKLYGFDCAMCHGDNGDGKGDMATDIKNVTDFTNADAMKNLS